MNISLNSSDLTNPGNFRLQYRPVTSYNPDWVVNNSKAIDSDATSKGKLWFSGTNIVNFGQFILSRVPNPCPQIIYTSAVTIEKNQKLQAFQNIQSSGNILIDIGSKIIFSAGNYINLEPNFEVKKGATFKTELGGCDNN